MKPYFSVLFATCFLCHLPLDGQVVDSFVDTRDDQVYTTVKIGTQWWMQENLNTGVFIDDGITMTDNSVIEKYAYNNDEGTTNTFGGLYLWDEVMQYTRSEGAQGICPDGWHVPTLMEWQELQSVLAVSHGADSVINGYLADFKVLPVNGQAYFWMSTDVEMLPRFAWLCHISTNEYHQTLIDHIKTTKCCVRCILDNVDVGIHEELPDDKTIYYNPGSLGKGIDIFTIQGKRGNMNNHGILLIREGATFRKIFID